MDFADYTPSMGGSLTGILGGSGSTGSSMSGQLQSALGNLEAAINMGNQRAYDLALGQLLGVFNGQNTVDEQRLMGVGANGQPTLDAKSLAEKQREADLGAQMSLLDTGAKLTGPKDYGDFMNFTGGGKSLMQQVMAGRPASSAPVGDMEPMDLYALLQKFGLGPGQTATANPASAPNFTGAGGGGTNPNQPDNMTPMPTDYSAFPTMANDSDINYAKAQALAGAGYDPTGYQSFEQANGGNPDWTPLVTHPATLGTKKNTFQTAWGTYDPGAGYGPMQNPSITRLAYNQLVLGRNQGQNPDTDALNDSEIGKRVADWVANQYEGGTPETTTGTGEPSWFKDYMAALIGMGPSVNRGAAENLPLLYQLGLANPQGLSQILNPQGNIDPGKWDSLGPVGQSLLAQAAGKVFGWDPTEFVNQINATRPLGAPVSGVQVGYAPLALAQ